MPRTPHVAEPWEVSHRAKAGEDAVIAAKNRPLTICQVHEFGAESMEHTTAEANATANRIVACVNACAGMKEPQLDIPEAVLVLAQCAQWLDHFRRELGVGTAGPSADTIRFACAIIDRIGTADAKGFRAMIKLK